MKLPPFILERHFARWEFAARHVLCASDCESITIGELLALEPGASDELAALHLGYTETAGHPELRSAIASLYETISPAEVLVHVGAEEAIFTFMNATLAPGDSAIVHCPAYQSLITVAERAGARVVRWLGREEDRWSIDADDLPALIDRDTRVVVLNLPHNPTGYLMSRERFLATVEVARTHGLTLFSDEVYRGLEPAEGDRLPAACDLYERAVSLGVMSKSYGLAGLRIGWVASHDKDLLAAMVQVKDYLSICASAPAELLARVALAHGETLVARNRTLLQANLALADEFFARHPQVFHWQRPVAGPVAFPRLVGGGAQAFCQRLVSRAGIMLAPSSAFGAGDDHVRFGFGRVDLSAALAALDDYLTHSM